MHRPIRAERGAVPPDNEIQRVRSRLLAALSAMNAELMLLAQGSSRSLSPGRGFERSIMHAIDP